MSRLEKEASAAFQTQAHLSLFFLFFFSGAFKTQTVKRCDKVSLFLLPGGRCGWRGGGENARRRHFEVQDMEMQAANVFFLYLFSRLCFK